MVRLHSLYLHFWSSGSSGSSSFTFWWKIYRNIWRAKAPRLYWMNTWCIWRLNAHNKDELVWCGSMSLSADSRLVLVRWPAWEPGRGMRGMSDLRLSYGRTLAHTQNLTFVLGHYFGHNTLAGRHSGRGFSLKVQDMPMLPSHTVVWSLSNTNQVMLKRGTELILYCLKSLLLFLSGDVFWLKRKHKYRRCRTFKQQINHLKCVCLFSL